jgi:hypothetical protein
LNDLFVAFARHVVHQLVSLGSIQCEHFEHSIPLLEYGCMVCNSGTARSDGGFTTGREEAAAGERTIPRIPDVDTVSFIPTQGPWHCTSVIHCGVVGRAKALHFDGPSANLTEVG